MKNTNLNSQHNPHKQSHESNGLGKQAHSEKSERGAVKHGKAEHSERSERGSSTKYGKNEDSRGRASAHEPKERDEYE
jgi:hypothetical protein